MYNLVNIPRTVEQTKPVLNIVNQTVRPRAYEIQLQLFAIRPSK